MPIHTRFYVRRMQGAEGLAEECPDVKAQHKRRNRLTQCVRYGNHLFRRDHTLLATLSGRGACNFQQT